MASGVSIKTALIRQTSASSTIQFSTDNVTWNDISSWPFTIGNYSPDTNILRVKFTTDIVVPIKTDYFVLSSSNIIIDGNYKTVTVPDYPSFPGLISNGTENNKGNNNIIVTDLSVLPTGTTTLRIGQGWICKQYFGNGTTNNLIQSCYSSGTIPSQSGGITGPYTAVNSTNFSIFGCYATGSILDGNSGKNSGGIVGPFSGKNSTSFYIESCTYSGDINGNGSGGIIGINSSNVTINFCSSSGIIKCGGIAGDYCGISGLVTISDCFTKGDIGSTVGTTLAGSAGGIIGANGGNVNITRCYSTGQIGGDGKNECGGIVGSNSAVNVYSCFTIGNIYKQCGGIVGKNFAKGASVRCDIQDCYTLGNIDDYAGGIAGPEYAQNSLATCYIQYCFSLGQLNTISSGGIIAPTTGTYPSSGPGVKSFVINSCHNNFTYFSNSIVGLGYNSGTGPVDPLKSTVIEKYGNELYIKPALGNTAYDSKEQAASANSSWYKSYRVLDRTLILRLTRGYYIASSDIIQKISFSTIDKLGLTISEYLVDDGIGVAGLLNNNINFSPINKIPLKTCVFDPLNISLNDLFTANYDLVRIKLIGYTIGDILLIRPNTTYKSLIDAGYNFKTNTVSPNTINDMIASSVNPVLTVADIVKAGFYVNEIRAKHLADPNGVFSMANILYHDISTSYLLGNGGFGWWDLKGAGFNTNAFRRGNQSVAWLFSTAGFKAQEFQGSGFSYSALSSFWYMIPFRDGQARVNSGFTDNELIEIGFNRDIINAIQASTNASDPFANYLLRGVPINKIPKYTSIRNIKTYSNNRFTPMDFLNNNWSVYKVVRMGFDARVLLDTNRIGLSDLKTAGYTDAQILASGHSSATSDKLTAAIILTKNNPPLITEIVTDEGSIYVYFSNVYSNASPEVTAIGYSLDAGETYTFVPSIESPLIIPNVDFSIEYSLYITSVNGYISDANYVSIATKKKPIKKQTKPDAWKITIGVLIISAVLALAAVGIDQLKQLEGGVQMIIDGAEINTSWVAGKAAHLPHMIKQISKEVSPNPIYTSKLYGETYNITNNDNFLFSIPTITNVIGINRECYVYFTDNIKNNETIDDIYYTIDDGITWQPCRTTPQSTSPIIIDGEFSLNDSLTISIRYYNRKQMTNVDITSPNTTVVACKDGLNYMYSKKTNSTYTHTVKMGCWSSPSNSFGVGMRYGPLPPIYYHIWYDKNTKDANLKGKAIVYIDQRMNCSGVIFDYQWSTDGNTWYMATNLNFQTLLPNLTKAEWDPTSVLTKLTIPGLKKFIIDVGTSRTSYNIMIRALTVNGESDPTGYRTTTTKLISTWLKEGGWAQ